MKLPLQVGDHRSLIFLSNTPLVSELFYNCKQKPAGWGTKFSRGTAVVYHIRGTEADWGCGSYTIMWRKLLQYRTANPWAHWGPRGPCDLILALWNVSNKIWTLNLPWQLQQLQDCVRFKVLTLINWDQDVKQILAQSENKVWATSLCSRPLTWPIAVGGPRGAVPPKWVFACKAVAVQSLQVYN